MSETKNFRLAIGAKIMLVCLIALSLFRSFSFFAADFLNLL
jgi:hypothetical protein